MSPGRTGLIECAGEFSHPGHHRNPTGDPPQQSETLFWGIDAENFGSGCTNSFLHKDQDAGAKEHVHRCSSLTPQQLVHVVDRAVVGWRHIGNYCPKGLQGYRWVRRRPAFHQSLTRGPTGLAG